MSSPDRWKEISSLYASALDRPAAERAAYLAKMCMGDDWLREEVTSLLDCHADPEFLTTSASEVVAASVPLDQPTLVGRQLGAYRLDAPLGAGGMGEVYRATDTRLHREVAIKILPSHLRADPSLRQRFEREAQAVAGLRHPHICVLHDVGTADGIDFLVLELLDGETLAARLGRGPLPLPDALRYALEIADALAATHGHGMVHRDLKPGNVMLTASGARLFDFGLAKLLRTGAGPASLPLASPLSSILATGPAGTLAYMTPEQLNHHTADQRSDVFAFGVVLYEMVTGFKAFDGTDRLAVATAIRDTEPAPLPVSITTTAPALEPFIRRCLHKEPSARWPDAGAMADALREVAIVHPPARIEARRPRTVRVVVGVVAASIGLLLLADRSRSIFDRVWAPPSMPPPTMRQVTYTGDASAPELSHDGRQLAYWSRGGLVIQNLADGTTRRVVDGAGMFPVRWSADDRRLLFNTRADSFVATRAGDAAWFLRRVMAPTFPVWWRDESMAAGITADAEEVTIVATPLDASPVQDVTRICPVADAGSWSGLDWSPAADAFVVTNQDERLRERIQTVRPGDCRIETVVSSDRGRLLNARWGQDGKRIYYLEGSTLRKVATGTSPAAVPVSVREHTGHFSLSTSGLLAYEQRTSYANLSLLARGTPSTIRPLTEGTHLNTAPAPSPDGTRVAFMRQGNVYIVSADATSMARVPHEFATATAVAWSPDGLRLAVLTSQGPTASLWIIDPQGGSPRSFDVPLLRPGRPDRVQWVSPGRVVIRGAPSSTAMTALDLASGETTVLWSSQSPGEFALVPSAQVSPDLTRAAVRFEQGGIVMVHVFSLAAGGARFERMLLRESRGVGGAVIGWSDDNWVFVLRENGRDIVKIPSAGGRPVPVLTVPDSLRKVNEIRMSSRGEPFVAVTAESLSDIWVVDGFDP